jgi:hypothetical protein
MPSFYRVYLLNEEGRITDPPEIIWADDDEGAIRQAKARLAEHAVEVWREGRLVVRLEPSGKSVG